MSMLLPRPVAQCGISPQGRPDSSPAHYFFTEGASYIATAAFFSGPASCQSFFFEPFTFKTFTKQG
ncbi:MAG: hypothetical protein PSX71_00780 [bacterium]|nr:hypothetical protein [bacterium]